MASTTLGRPGEIVRLVATIHLVSTVYRLNGTPKFVRSEVVRFDVTDEAWYHSEVASDNRGQMRLPSNSSPPTGNVFPP